MTLSTTIVPVGSVNGYYLGTHMIISTSASTESVPLTLQAKLDLLNAALLAKQEEVTSATEELSDNSTAISMGLPYENQYSFELSFTGVPSTLPNLNTPHSFSNIAFWFRTIPQFFEVSTQVSLYNLIGTTPETLPSTIEQVKFIRDSLNSLKRSGGKYKDIDSLFVQDISDLVGLFTLGHTIDTMALDPEDWWSEERVDRTNGRLLSGPAKVFPTTSENKVRKEIRNHLQQAYEALNKSQFNSMFHERSVIGVESGNPKVQVLGDGNLEINLAERLQFVNVEPLFKSTQIDNLMSLVPVPRGGSTVDYGLTKFALSLNNTGDVAGVGFSKYMCDPVEEWNSLQVNDNLKPLISYLNPIRRVDFILDKPNYTSNQVDDVLLGGTAVNALIDNTGRVYKSLPGIFTDEVSINPQ